MSWAVHQMKGFAWRCRRSEDIMHIALEGELDISAIDMARAMMRDAMADDATTIVLDLGKLDYIDSVGISLLIRTKSAIEARSGRMFIRRHSSASRRLIEVAGLDRWFAPTDDLGNELVPCPICDDEISPLSRICHHCGTEL